LCKKCAGIYFSISGTEDIKCKKLYCISFVETSRILLLNIERVFGALYFFVAEGYHDKKYWRRIQEFSRSDKARYNRHNRSAGVVKCQERAEESREKRRKQSKMLVW